MYESDGVDEMYMDYRKNHPFDKKDKIFFLKVTLGIVLLVAFTIISDRGCSFNKNKTPVIKENNDKQRNNVDSLDTIKMRDYMRNTHQISMFQDTTKTR